MIPLVAAIINEPSAPNEADSVGVAIPKRIEPSTNIIKTIGGKIVINNFLKLISSFDLLLTGKFVGLRIEQKISKMYKELQGAFLVRLPQQINQHYLQEWELGHQLFATLARLRLEKYQLIKPKQSREELFDLKFHWHK